MPSRIDSRQGSTSTSGKRRFRPLACINALSDVEISPAAWSAGVALAMLTENTPLEVGEIRLREGEAFVTVAQISRKCKKGEDAVSRGLAELASPEVRAIDVTPTGRANVYTWRIPQAFRGGENGKAATSAGGSSGRTGVLTGDASEARPAEPEALAGAAHDVHAHAKGAAPSPLLHIARPARWQAIVDDAVVDARLARHEVEHHTFTPNADQWAAIGKVVDAVARFAVEKGFAPNARDGFALAATATARGFMRCKGHADGVLVAKKHPFAWLANNAGDTESFAKKWLVREMTPQTSRVVEAAPESATSNVVAMPSTARMFAHGDPIGWVAESQPEPRAAAGGAR